ncbi:MAG: SAM-dependent chlorinase/fluorinase [Flavobacteriales bacterium]|nr:SAM-dependent chlorinase/fluorinase [Flavobacteriales bacterium]
MSIITLTTDMGTRDHYVAAVKGRILGLFPGATIVDVTHEVKPFDNAHAAFVVRNAWPHFPEGTVHVIGVNPEADEVIPHVAVRQGGHWFIGADNGLFSLILGGRPEAVFSLHPTDDPDAMTFPTKGVFARAACHLAQGRPVAEIGSAQDGIRQMIGFAPAADPESIRGAVIHIDVYGNAVTNIHRDLFVRVVKDRAFRIAFGRSQNDITTLHRTYGEVPQGERVAFFGASGLLEIAVNKGAEGSGGGAARLFGLHVQDPVRIELQDVLTQRAFAS